MALLTLNRALVVHRLFNLPAMTKKEIAIYKKTLISLYDGKFLNIFEYGSGFSTVYFAKFLRKEGVNFHVDAVDNHEGWYGRVKNLIDRAGLQNEVTVHLHPFQPFWEKEGWDWQVSPPVGKFAPASSEEINYIQKPLTLNKKFDFILVDARFRRRCLEVAAQALRKNGIVCLHDAERSHYHSTTKAYPYSQFIDSGHFYPFEKMAHRMWLGSLENSAVKELTNVA
ncbi:MAG: class I SAM-dependent methyltransferase [Candidatus Omnitrophica bacterium]|nr:class I SAM-dependent methyltransferase [Candidatus Omnitrophota bacterium]